MVDRSEPFAFVRDLATRWDLIAIVVVIGLLTFFAEASRGLFEPLAKLSAAPLSLDPVNLPFYAARTTLRMFAALALSLVFTFTYATWAAKSARAEKLLVPILDILQSVPILGFISITVVFFMSLVPGRVLGAEFAAIFAIFTSQAWNMAFSFYQSLRTVPHELEECAASFRLSAWMRFWRLEVPFAMPALLVLRGGLGVDQRRQHQHRAAGRRLLHRTGDPAGLAARDRLGDRDHAGCDPAV
jgi:NitT/TauT family transport system permease protein